LLYIEMTSSTTTSDRRPIIHGGGDKAKYVNIDFTRTAEPLSDDSDWSILGLLLRSVLWEGLISVLS
jgi:hypothetical protein